MLDVTDIKMRKLMMMHDMLHPRSNVSKLPRAEESYLVYQTALTSRGACSVMLVVLRNSC